MVWIDLERTINSSNTKAGFFVRHLASCPHAPQRWVLWSGGKRRFDGLKCVVVGPLCDQRVELVSWEDLVIVRVGT